jgi:hypothetical protein
MVSRESAALAAALAWHSKPAGFTAAEHPPRSGSDDPAQLGPPGLLSGSLPVIISSSWASIRSRTFGVTLGSFWDVADHEPLRGADRDPQVRGDALGALHEVWTVA